MEKLVKLNICHLYPDLLNLYGDRGNILCLRRRLEWRGIETSLTSLSAGQGAKFSDFDLFFIGGGQDFEQEVLLEDLARGKAEEIKSAIEDGKTFLTICGGYQMLGSYYRTWDGKQYDFIGALDLHTIGERERMTGNYVFECLPESGGSQVVAFENHSGKTYLGGGVSPLGKILSGSGNNGGDGTEGVRYKNVFGSYGHGPLMPKNPRLADFILGAALSGRYPGISLEELDDDAENSAHGAMFRRLLK